MPTASTPNAHPFRVATPGSAVTTHDSYRHRDDTQRALFVRWATDPYFAQLVRTRPAVTQWSLWVLVLFIWSGDLKGAAVFRLFPVDLTLLAGMSVAGICFWKLATRERNINGLGLTPLVVMVAAVPSIAVSSLDGYSSTKLINFVLLGSLGVFGTMTLVQSTHEIQAFMQRLAFICFIIVFFALISGPDGAVENRYSAFGDTIVLGRDAGLLALFCLITALKTRGFARTFWVVTMFASIFAMLGSGSKGPALMFLLCAPLVLKRGAGEKKVSFGQVLAGLAVVVIAVLLALQFAPASATGRFSVTKQTRSNSLREESYSRGSRYLIAHPIGVGFGDFGDAIDTFAGYKREYPHNLIIEVGIEQGWVSLGVWIGIVVTALRILWIQRANRIQRLLCGSLAFMVLNTMVSGDLDDNRSILALLALAFISQSLRGLRRTDRTDRSARRREWRPTDIRSDGLLRARTVL
jgi:O-antigen ligase